MIEILENYVQYVPNSENNVPVPFIVFCDALSCGRVEGAHGARIDGQNSRLKLYIYEASPCNGFTGNRYCIM